MKRYIFYFLNIALFLMLLVLISGCNSKTTTAGKTDDAELKREKVSGNGEYLDWIDWKSIQAKLPAEEARSLQTYLPVLEGEEFTLIYMNGYDDEAGTYLHDKKTLSIEEWVGWMYEREGYEVKVPVVDSFEFADVFQSGSENMCVLFRHFGWYWLIFHQEDDVTYGIELPVRWFFLENKDGLYSGSGGATYHTYYRMHFAKGDYWEEEIAEIIDFVLYIDGEKKTQEEYEKWKENNIKGEVVTNYEPKGEW